jgi:hypothetical protein
LHDLLAELLHARLHLGRADRHLGPDESSRVLRRLYFHTVS